ncbi:MAG: IS4 family transposase, partial [Syntrophobacterales bacterium]|nr:IS4 family transposase [Syntrophobacterales bacterium]
PPGKPPTLQEATKMIGQLGGFLGRTRDGFPGPATLWQGMQRLGDIAVAWCLARSP